MNTRCMILAVFGLILAAGALGGTPVRGVVYDDANGNGRRDEGEAGIPGVGVSNGRAVVTTDAQGAYALEIDGDAVIFVIKPRDWSPPRDDRNRWKFYYVHRPNGAPAYKFPGVEPTGPLPASVDFALRRSPEPDRFRMLLLGDTQPRDSREVWYVAHDIVADLVGTDAGLAVALGDNTFDQHHLAPELTALLGRIGCPMHYVAGNHDLNYDAPADEAANESFLRHYGPPYYGFDYGPVHFVVLENIHWRPAEGDRKAHYTSGLDAAQLEFLRNDLATVPKDRLVVLLMHIPLNELEQKAEVLKLLGEHPHTLSVSGHTHTIEHLFLGEKDGWPRPEPHHHLIAGTTCGSWWTGAPDELGIPHATMADGAPNGWFVATFEGPKYTLTFRPARRPADYQMNVYAPDVVPAAQTAETEVVVNVFAGSARSTVTLTVDDAAPVTLERFTGQDPAFLALKELEKGEPPPPGRKLPKPVKTTHLWRGKLPVDLKPGVHVLTVKTTDLFGQTYTVHRLLRVE